MTVKLSTLEAGLLARAASMQPVAGNRYLSALRLSPAEKAACKRLVKKGLMTNVMDTFYHLTDAGLEHTRVSTDSTVVQA